MAGLEGLLLTFHDVPFLGQFLPLLIELPLLFVEGLLYQELLLLSLLEELLQLLKPGLLLGELLLLRILLFDLLNQSHLLLVYVGLLCI